MVSKLQPLIQKLIVAPWLRLTEPASRLIGSQDQHRARLLAHITLMAVILLPLYKLYRAVSGETEHSITNTVTLIAFLLVLAAYILSRTCHYKVGVFVVVIPLSAALIAQGILRSAVDLNAMTMGILWLVPLVLFTSILLPFRYTVMLVAADVVVVNIILLLNPGIHLIDDHFPFDYLFVVFILLLVSGYLSRRYNRQIETQAQDLAESEERYRSLFESGFVGIAVHENNILLDVNAGFLNSLGYTLPEVLGKHILQFFIPMSQMAGPAIMDTTRYEMVAQRKDGSVFQIEIYRKNVTYRGRPAQVLAFHDITEHKQSEENRIKLLAERERSHVLRQFISDASHDLRTPLATIHTSLYLLRKTTPDTPNVTRYLDAIQAQAVHLNEVLESLLLMARLDDPDNYYEIGLLDLNQAAQNVVETCQSFAAKKQQILEFRPAPELPSVCADRDEIRRAIRLLLDNAIQYTQDGGKITVSTRRIHQIVLLEIQDNGPGISTEDLPHIFQRFYRGDKARGQAQNVGAGLGLPIARKIVETHNGTLDVETEVGKGSTFQIFLPIANP